MDLKTFLSQNTPSQIRALADDAGTKVIYLRHIAGGHRRPSAEMCARIERASGGEVRRIDLRPDLFGPVDSSDSPRGVRTEA